MNLIYCMLDQQQNDNKTEQLTVQLIESMGTYLSGIKTTPDAEVINKDYQGTLPELWIPDYIQADGEMDDAMAIALASLWNPNLHVSLQLPTKKKYVEAMENEEGSDKKFDAAVATLKKKGYHVFEDPLSGNSDKLKTGLKAFA